MNCTPHRVAQVSLVRVISWSSHDERISSTLSPPFFSTSSSSHSSLTSCTSSCTSSTTLRTVATLRTSPERRWTLLTTLTSSQNLMDPCHMKNDELPKHFQKYKERVVLWEDNVKDAERCRAVFTEHGASASQIATAKFMDTISKLLGMAGRPSDAVSA